MHNIYLKDLVKLANGNLICGNENTILTNFSKDTRTMSKGDIYIGIKGEVFDGSTLYKEALDKGAIGCILNDNIDLDKDLIKNYKDVFIIVVKDTIDAIQKLASYKRDLYNIPVIAVTGSAGKTSTKDIITSVLNEKYNVLSTIGNYNNHIGVPLTILRLKDEDCLVVEMGMNNLKEISKLSKIAKPTVSVITNVGTAHIGNLGSRENILKAKLEILDGMDSDGILVVNNDNDLLHEYTIKNKDKNIITFGIDNNSDFMAKNIINDTFSSVFSCNLYDKDELFKINVPGNHFVLNGLCAISIGSIFNMKYESIKKGIESFILTKNRMDIEKVNNYFVINDSYNANLDSMKSAINYLKTLKGRKVAILGDMLELGSFSEKLHREVGKTLYDDKIDLVITVGSFSKYIKDELNNLNFNNVYSFDCNEDAINFLKNNLKENDNILIKASNSMHFNEIYEFIKTYN